MQKLKLSGTIERSSEHAKTYSNPHHTNLSKTPNLIPATVLHDPLPHNLSSLFILCSSSTSYLTSIYGMQHSIPHTPYRPSRKRLYPHPSHRSPPTFYPPLTKPLPIPPNVPNAIPPYIQSSDSIKLLSPSRNQLVCFQSKSFSPHKPSNPSPVHAMKRRPVVPTQRRCEGGRYGPIVGGCIT
jgi:hypothetical protein